VSTHPGRRAALYGLALMGLVAACASAARATAAGAGAAPTLEQAVALYQQGKYADAEKILRGLQGPDASAYLSVALARQQRFAEAEAPASSALAANPTHAVAVEGLGQSLVGQKRYDDAIARMSAALAAKSDLAYAYYWRGMAYYNKRQPDKMVGDFENFLKLSPQAPEAAAVRQLLATFK
jgi:tetratricopeptide (TPR) repeat protein